MFATSRAAGLELSSALTHAPSLADFILLYEPLKPSRAGSPTLFPRHLQHVSFLCGRERKWNGKSAPPPSVATWQGRRAVGQEPAGHSRAYLWSAFSLLQSEALRSPACLCTLLILFLTVSHTLKSKNWSQEQPEKMHFLLTHYVAPLLPFPDYLY